MESSELLNRWRTLRADHRHLRAVDCASQLGVSEAELVASACHGHEDLHSMRLMEPALGVLEKLHELGPVKTITRNAQAVIEVEGNYAQVESFGHVAQCVGEIDLRIFPKRWSSVFHLQETLANSVRRSIQFFDVAGAAIHKVFATQDTALKNWEKLLDGVGGNDSPLVIEPKTQQSPLRPDSTIDVKGLRSAWQAMQDSHEFFQILQRFEVGREQALRLVGQDLAEPLAPTCCEALLRSLAETEVPCMFFVGNPGLIQIFSGTFQKVVVAHGWLNILDPKFNLHLRATEIDSAWVVRKPTQDGIVTSLELYTRNNRDQVLLLVGKRKPGQSENMAWRNKVEEVLRLYPARAA